MKRWLTLLACFLLTAGAAPQGAPVEIREWPVPWQDTRPRDPAVDGQGRVWFVGQKGGVHRPARSEERQGREGPHAGGRGQGPAHARAGSERRSLVHRAVRKLCHRGRLWLVETGPQPNRLVGFDPESRRFFSTTEIPSGGSNVRHMIFDAKTRTLWFGTDKNTIARARVP